MVFENIITIRLLDKPTLLSENEFCHNALQITHLAAVTNNFRIKDLLEIPRRKHIGCNPSYQT